MVNRKTSSSECNLDALKKESGDLYLQGKFKRALNVTERALTLAPKDLSLLNNASSLAVMIGALSKAEKYFRARLEVKPDDAEFCFHLGKLLKDQQRFDEAEKLFLRALQANPDFIEANLLLGKVYSELNRIDEAEKVFYEAIKISPNHAEIYYNFGLFLKEQHRYEESKKSILKALSIDPAYADANHVMGFFHLEDKNFADAEKVIRLAIEIKPELVDARWNLSQLLLSLKRFEEGWNLYETRFQLNALSRESMATIPPAIPAKYYGGESLSGKNLLIWPEQGIGDEVMFASVIPELEVTSAKIVLACDKRMVKLFSRSFPFLRVLAKDPANQYPNLAQSTDCHIGIGSLPRLYRNDINAFKTNKPYLMADEQLVDKWKQRFAELTHNFNVGISWRGGNNPIGQHDRSIELLDCLPVLELPANFINLQYGDHQTELSELQKRSDIFIHDWDDADPLKDLDNFAAQIKALDLVVSIDNSTVHFSGALGVETFVMLPFNQDWRWAEECDDSYWYPGSLKLFRQKKYGVWGEVIERIAAVLARCLQ